MKRTLLASFTDVLLLPVTIVPKAVGAVGAVGAAITTGITAGLSSAAGGMNMNALNGKRGSTANTPNMTNGGYSEFKGVDESDGVVFEIGADIDDERDLADGANDLKSEKDGGFGLGLSDVKEERWDNADNDGASVDTGSGMKVSDHMNRTTDCF